MSFSIGMLRVSVNVMSLSMVIVVALLLDALFMTFFSSFSFLTCTAFSKEAPLIPFTNRHTNKEVNITTNRKTVNKELLRGTQNGVTMHITLI
jgi:hypothetical protein